MKGLIFIPDISGFTRFVRDIDIDKGMLITQRLLQVIMDHNTLGMEVSEIEGDAVLFYKLGEPPPLNCIVRTFRTMQAAFNKTFLELKSEFQFEADLYLKLIVHYGEILLYNINGFKKLFGQTIIEAHRLLKTSTVTKDYILVTEDYMKAQELNISELLVSGVPLSANMHSLIEGVRNIAYQVLYNTKRFVVFES